MVGYHHCCQSRQVGAHNGVALAFVFESGSGDASLSSYLAQRALCLDVWDGDSLFWLGSASVPLRGLLPGSTPGSTAACCLTCTLHPAPLTVACIVSIDCARRVKE